MAVEIVADSVICGVEVSQLERIEQSSDKQTNQQFGTILDSTFDTITLFS